MPRHTLSILALAAIVVAFFAINMLASTTLRSARLDLTENKLFTLPAGAKRIAQAVDEPIRFKLYYSRQLLADNPGIVALERRIEDTLYEFIAASRGKIELEVIDPEPSSEVEDEAMAAGMVGQPIGNASGDRAYFGLVATNSTDGREVIPWLGVLDPRLLTYELARRIYVLSNPVRPKVAVMSALPVDGAEPSPLNGGQAQRPWLIMNELRSQFDVIVHPADGTAIPDDVGVLVVIFPKTFSTGGWYAIDQFIMRGGRAIFALDPQCLTYIPPEAMQNQMAMYTADRSADLGPLGDAWGVDIAPKVVAGDQANAIVVGSPGQNSRPISYVAYLMLQKDRLSESDAITTGLGAVTYQSGGVIEQTEDSPLKMEVLLSTSEESMRIDVSKLAFPDPEALVRDFVPSGQSLPLGVRLTGKAPSAFGDAAPAGAKNLGEHLSESTEPINVIVLGDADMLSDRAWAQEVGFGGMTLGYQRFADNGSFILNAVENLSGNSDLMSIRASASYFRPFTRVEELRRAAEKESLAEAERLQEEQRATEQRINEIQRTRTDGQRMILTEEQQEELRALRAKQIETRKALRQVQLELNREIKRLGAWIKFINIGLVPAVVALFAMGLGAYRVSRRGADRRRVRDAEGKRS